jgi:hypothetical protein
MPPPISLWCCCWLQVHTEDLVIPPAMQFELGQLLRARTVTFSTGDLACTPFTAALADLVLLHTELQDLQCSRYAPPANHTCICDTLLSASQGRHVFSGVSGLRSSCCLHRTAHDLSCSSMALCYAVRGRWLDIYSTGEKTCTTDAPVSGGQH